MRRLYFCQNYCTLGPVYSSLLSLLTYLFVEDSEKLAGKQQCTNEEQSTEEEEVNEWQEIEEERDQQAGEEKQQAGQRGTQRRNNETTQDVYTMAQDHKQCTRTTSK